MVSSWTADDRLRLIGIKIERANKHIAELEDFVRDHGVLHGKSIQRNAATDFPLLQFGSLNIYQPDIPAIIGDAVHNLRSALDHLAYHLVMVGTENGESRTESWEKIQFPIAYSETVYKSKRTAERLEGMKSKAIKAIDALKPYKGGNEQLWLLFKLDNTDKHSFILPIGQDVIIAGISIRAAEPFFVAIGEPNSVEDEPAVGKANTVLPTLHQLSRLVGNIVASFRPHLQGPVAPKREVSVLDEFKSIKWAPTPWDERGTE